MREPIGGWRKIAVNVLAAAQIIRERQKLFNIDINIEWWSILSYWDYINILLQLYLPMAGYKSVCISYRSARNFEHRSQSSKTYNTES